MDVIYRRLVGIGLGLTILSTACSSDTAAERAPVYAPAESPTTKAVEEEPAAEDPGRSQPDPGRSADIAMVAVTIDEIGVTTVAPAAWPATPEGDFVGADGTLAFGAFVSSEAPDPNIDGFELVDQPVAADRAWDLYARDVGGEVVQLAFTEAGSLTYIVSLQASRESADEYADSVVMPVLEAFEVSEVVPDPISLAGTPPDGADLATMLDELIAGTVLPAVGVTVFDGEQILESAVAGVRRRGDPTPVELSDTFSIGSNVKAMTATLVATFVDEGVISWDTTVADVYGDTFPDLDDARARVTIRQLLSHTSGIDDEQAVIPLVSVGDELALIEQRSLVAEITLSHPMHHSVGRYSYSNIGYTIVGAMLEELTGSTWEELVRARVFDPLGMDSCGFYAPGTPGQVDQPWGHLDERGGEALDPGAPDADLDHFIAPAGLVHCAMADWTRFLQSQLRGFQGAEDELISPESFVALQTPASDAGYALGWVIAPDPSGAVTMYHQGSNLRFTAEVWLIPAENRGLVTITNLGDALATPPLDRVGEAMFARYADTEGENP